MAKSKTEHIYRCLFFKLKRQNTCFSGIAKLKRQNTSIDFWATDDNEGTTTAASLGNKGDETKNQIKDDLQVNLNKISEKKFSSDKIFDRTI